MTHMEKICSGPEHGTCENGNCLCFQDWTGEACECPTSTKTCISPDNHLCSDNGICICGKCHCNEIDDVKYFGNFCEECSTCPNRCDEYSDCVECALGTLQFRQNVCTESCNKLDIQRKEKIDNDTSKNEIHCKYFKGNCSGFFKYFYDENGEVKIVAQETFECNGFHFDLEGMKQLQRVAGMFG